jgi:hypothetical protein
MSFENLNEDCLQKDKMNDIIEVRELDANVSQSPGQLDSNIFYYRDFTIEVEEPDAKEVEALDKQLYELQLRVASLMRDRAGDKARFHSGELIRKYLKFCQVEKTKELEPFFPAADSKKFVGVARLLRKNREKYFEQPDRNMTWDELTELIREYHPMVKEYPELLELMDFIRSKLEPHRQLPFRKVK